MLKVFWAELSKDLLMAYRRRGDLLNPLLFFVMVLTLFPLGVSPSANVLSTLAPGVLWVAALLAALLSLDHLFRSDFDDGTLEQLLLSSESIYVVTLAKTLAHWLTTGLPLTLLAPLLATMLFLPTDGLFVLTMSLLIGTPVLSLVGAIAAGLTVGLKKGGVLISLLVIPLYIPVLIFGAGAVQAAIDGLPVLAYFSILGAMLALSIVLAPFAISASLKVSVSY